MPRSAQIGFWAQTDSSLGRFENPILIDSVRFSLPHQRIYKFTQNFNHTCRQSKPCGNINFYNIEFSTNKCSNFES
ncbi:hypothetical protein Hanom_Chr02g00096861 [Helianthus anomalus]